MTNVVVFSLWFWEVDAWGAAERAAGSKIPRASASPRRRCQSWSPTDGSRAIPTTLFLSFTNATAFSPTDTLPVRIWAKMTMMVESVISLIAAIPRYRAGDRRAPGVRRERAAPQQAWEKVVEVLEVAVLAIVAMATAFSGYQGTQWGGEQARLYGLASSTRFEAEAASTLSAARSSSPTRRSSRRGSGRTEAGDRQLESMLERRFTPSTQTRFETGWRPTRSPIRMLRRGPAAMPGVLEPLDDEGRETERPGVPVLRCRHGRRETANKYVRLTVLFASVLFLVAVAQRFRLRGAPDRRERTRLGVARLHRLRESHRSLGI